MRKLLIFSIIMCMFSFAKAQMNVATQKEIQQFYESKTYVVMSNNMFSGFNGAIKEAMNKFWNVTEFEFITHAEYLKKRTNSSNSFIAQTTAKFMKKDKDKTKYTFLSLMIGKNINVKKELPTLASFPLCYKNANDEHKWIYKLGTVLRFLQNHVELTKNHPELNAKNIAMYYNKNIEKMKEKTLYVLKKDLAPKINTLSKIKKYYPGKVKIVTKDEVKKAIADQDDSVVFLHKIGPTRKTTKIRCWKTIFGASDAKMYYFNYHKIKKKKKPDAFLVKDLKKLKRKN